MEKDLTIIRLLVRLRKVLDQRPVEVIDYWDGDLCAIGLERDGKLVYINTRPYINDPVVRYDYDLEVRTGTAVDDWKVVKSEFGASEEDLVRDLQAHL
jgi:hypothetical protein